ncbi:hypothetical protein Agub_g4202 [Astrephomene gubernaculifera]|uniref:Uncharacterized protein n=1 Tax=Astrephomene gubernaculifera TaxID=47775 RepID=A0AAD3DNN6_9CHLO|nr:hypothetical protein Agub_g4202 [Astrephomene gubernaculifera]
MQPPGAYLEASCSWEWNRQRMKGAHYHVSLFLSPSVGRQAVLILRGTYAGQLGVVDAGYMGGPKARLRPIDAEGRENRAVNIDAVNVHALADAELAFRSFESPQRDALRPFLAPDQSQGPSTVQWSLPEKELGSHVAASDTVGGVPQQAAAAPSCNKVYRVPRSLLESFLLWLQVEQRVDYALERHQSGGSSNALAFMFSGKPYPPPLPRQRKLASFKLVCSRGASRGQGIRRTLRVGCPHSLLLSIFITDPDIVVVEEKAAHAYHSFDDQQYLRLVPEVVAAIETYAVKQSLPPSEVQQLVSDNIEEYARPYVTAGCLSVEAAVRQD